MAQEIQTQLGWEQTYDWTQNERAETIETLKDIGIKEYEGVLNSDVVIIILPGGKGCHTEMGIALGSQKHIVLFDQDRILNNLDEATTFYFLPQIKQWNGHIDDLDEIITSKSY
jgi:ABC-type antimicrobial peptide transport system ATPase subunit